MIVENSLILFYRGEGTSYHIDVFDLDNLSETYFAVDRFEYQSDVDADEGSLIRLGGSVYVAPHNKMLNLVDGTWCLNDYVSTTPIVNIPEQPDLSGLQPGEKAEGAVWVIDTGYEGSVLLRIGNGPDLYIQAYSDDTHEDIVDRIITEFENNTFYNDRYEFEKSIFDPGFGFETWYFVIITSKHPQDIGFKRVVVQEYDNTETLDDSMFQTFRVWGGIDPDAVGRLEQSRDFWYKARYVYSDGHVTKTCYPVTVETTNIRRRNRIEIKPVFDLDASRYAEVQLYRSSKGSEFFLIDTVRPEPEDINYNGFFFYDDYGQLSRNRLDESAYIWSDEHKVHAIVKDRYVRGNVRYKQREFELQGAIKKRPVENDRTIPPNTTLEIYARARFRNGMESLQSFVDTTSGDETDRGLQVELSDIKGPDVKEIAFYGKYGRNEKESGITVGAIDFYNNNIPSLATRRKSTEDQKRSVQQHLFLGWKYVMRVVRRDGISAVLIEDYVVDSEYDTENDNNEPDYNSRILFNRERGPYDLTERRFAFPDTLECSPISGYPQEYDLVGFRPLYFEYVAIQDPDNPTVTKQIKMSTGEWGDIDPKIPLVGIYKIAVYDGLQSAIQTGRLKARIEDQGVFSGDRHFAGKELQVLGLLDQTSGVQNILETDRYTFEYPHEDQVPPHDNFTNEFFDPPRRSARWIFPNDSKLYLVVDDSDLRDFTNREIQNESFLDDYSDVDIEEDRAGPDIKQDRDSKYSFTLLDVVLHDSFFIREQTKEPPQRTSVYVGPRDETYIPDDRLETTGWESVRDLSLQSSVVVEGDQTLIYLGRGFPDQDMVVLNRTGYTQKQRRGLTWWSLDESNIYSEIIEIDEEERLTERFPQQLMVSLPFAPDGNLGGSRTFLFSGIYNVPDDHGQIVHIDYARGNLLVFTEHGLVMVFVGEVISEQPSGTAVIDTARFLTDNQWMLRNLKSVQPRSIVQYEHLLFFSDGVDVWQYGEQLENITNGAVRLTGDRQVGGIDVENKEYRITDGLNTWAYSMETGEWSGPYTYSNRNTMLFRDRLYAVAGNDLVLHNHGNVFGTYPEYETIVEWPGNDFEESTIDKIFRKFFLDVEGDAEFQYSKDRKSWFGRPLSKYNNINGIYHAGVKQEYSNSKSLYWRFKTKAREFALKGVSFIWYVRDRL